MSLGPPPHVGGYAFGTGYFLALVSALVPASGSSQSSGDKLELLPGTSRDQPAIFSAGDAERDDVDVDSVTGCVVRVAYVIPSNRTPQTNGVEKAKWAIRTCRNWYADQMVRHGFPGKFPRFETESDGETPKVYVVNVTETDEYLRGDLWGRTISAAIAAGIPVWSSKQVWWLISEAHVQAPGGAISGGTALGASFGSGDDPGVGMLGGDALARFTTEYLTNNAGYANKIIPEIGPYPLVQGVSFPDFEGSTLSSVSSSILGAGVHEVSHAFGLPHDFRNDKNFAGNLMGNGLRGIRGNLYPTRYRMDYTRVSFAAALALSVSRYFNSPQNYTDNTRPALTITTQGTVSLVGGSVQISFNASDAGGLHCAWLQLNGDLVAEMVLSGSTTNATFNTPYFSPAQGNNYQVSVFDRHGNKQTAETSVIPETGSNRAPQPFVTLSSATVFAGQNVTLSAGESIDPGGSLSSVQVEWDLNGDNEFDTPPTTTKSVTRSFLDEGDRLVYARLTDNLGATSISTPLALRVELPQLQISQLGNDLELSWPVTASGWILQSTGFTEQLQWSNSTLPVTVRLGQYSVIVTNATTLESGALFRLTR